MQNLNGLQQLNNLIQMQQAQNLLNPPYIPSMDQER